MAPKTAASGLTRVGVYRRAVRASLERVWENVFDWEHLPWLHDASFGAIERVDSGDWGWRARIAQAPRERGRSFLLELLVDRDARRYVARTLEGTGKGTEIWTHLDVAGPHCTQIEVEFLVPGVAPGSIEALGKAYTGLYRRLWDEDEAMMMRREELLSHGAPAAPAEGPLDLGPLAELRERAPLVVEHAGRSWRVVEVEGEWVAHACVCPHWLGPLDAAPLEQGCVTCPWHGYRFDVRSGRSADGRGLRLPPAPAVRVDPATGRVTLGPAT